MDEYYGGGKGESEHVASFVTVPDSISSSVFNYTNDKTTSLTSSFTLTSSNPGCLVLSFTYKGNSVAEYGTYEYDNLDIGGMISWVGDDGKPDFSSFEETRSGPRYYITVLDSLTPPAVPTLDGAQFGSSGNTITLTFSAPTDTGSAAGITGTYVDFSCSELFEMADQATCKFTSKTSVEVFLSSTSSVVAGDPIVLRSGTLFAECDESVYDCSGTSSPTTSTSLVVLPDTAIVPTVVITGANSVPSCGDISLDSSMSSGSGGRDWTSFQWTFYSTAVDTTGMSGFISTVNSGTYSPTLKIPTSNLVPGEFYYFKLTLENFLRQSSTFETFYEVAVSLRAIPTVAIEGAATRIILASEELALFAVGEAATCDGEGVVIEGSNYVWDASGLESISIDKRYFKLPAFSLSPSSTTTFACTVTDSFGLTSSASVTVSVAVGDIIPRLTGGGRSIGVTGSIVLDGSESYDTDDPTKTPNGFEYAWNCIKTAPLYGESCSGFDNPITVSSLAMDSGLLSTLLAGGDEATVQITMKVKDDSREVSTTTLITILAVDPPEVSITPIYAAKVNPSQKLQIRGSVKSSADSAISAVWSSPHINDLEATASSVTSLALVAGPTGDVPFSLILPPLSLTGRSYTFYLSASFDSLTGATDGLAEVHVEVNEPPSGGVVKVEGDGGESRGIALTTQFTLSSLSWVDSASDLPLVYTFSYHTASIPSTTVVVSSLSAVHGDVYLPMGGGNSSTVYVVGTVADKYGSEGQATASVVVTQPVLTLEELGTKTEELTDKALVEGNTGTVFQVLSSSASIMNTVNCSLAPTCSSLNRASCSDGSAPHTCGICREGFFSTSGDSNTASNTACVSASGGCKNGIKDGFESDVDCGSSACEPCGVKKACGANGDCFSGLCGSGGTCVAPVRQCVGGCSEKGECKAKDFNSVDMLLAECTEDVACGVECECDVGFYGTDCSKSQDEQDEVMKQRRRMLDTLKAVSNLQDVTKEAVGQQAAGLESLVKKVEELDDTGRNLAFELVRNISKSCKSSVEGGEGIGRDTAVAIAESVSSLMVVGGGSSSGQGGAGGGEEISEAVDNLAEAQTGSLFVGEDPVVVVTENLKVSSEKVSIEQVGGKALRTPQSRLDIVAGREAAVLEFAGDGVAGVFEGMCNVGISVAELGKDLKGNRTTLGTTIMRLGMGCYGTGSGGKASTGYSPVLVTLPKTKSGGEEGRSVGGAGGTVIEYCGWDELRKMTCPGNSTEFAICTGPGQMAGNVTIECAGGGEAVKCGIESGGGWGDTCTVVKEGENNITCSCDVLGTFADGGRRRRGRRLNTIYDDQQSTEVGTLEQIDFGGLLVGIGGTFGKTLSGLTVLGWQDVEKNFVIFTTIGVVLLMG